MMITINCLKVFQINGKGRKTAKFKKDVKYKPHNHNFKNTVEILKIERNDTDFKRSKTLSSVTRELSPVQ